MVNLDQWCRNDSFNGITVYLYLAKNETVWRLLFGFRGSSRWNVNFL